MKQSQLFLFIHVSVPLQCTSPQWLPLWIHQSPFTQWEFNHQFNCGPRSLQWTEAHFFLLLNSTPEQNDQRRFFSASSSVILGPSTLTEREIVVSWHSPMNSRPLPVDSPQSTLTVTVCGTRKNSCVHFCEGLIKWIELSMIFDKSYLLVIRLSIFSYVDRYVHVNHSFENMEMTEFWTESFEQVAYKI